MEAVTATDQDLQNWYYTIELEPGRWTKGFEFPNVSLTRRLLSRVDVAGRSCLDLGCMEGMVSRLMARRGGIVRAWDRVNRSKQIFSGEQYGPLVDFVGPISERRETLREYSRHTEPADVVIFSGVLYHVLDPLGSLLHARQLVRNGGVMIVETAAINLPGQAAHFNFAGRFYDHPEQGNYWFPSYDLLVYLLKLCRLAPLDVAWFAQWGNLVRVAIACRACPSVTAVDAWAAAHQANDGEIGLNFSEFIDWDRCESSADPVPYQRPAGPGVSESLRASAIMAEADLKRLSVLRIGDTE